ncbi:MAG: hypothetical protein HW388_1764, partial [Dehalococcoidia bacterium]|nr:hypothetical protein [Dehalococcoidia bacterium]
MGPITQANSFYRNLYSWFDSWLPDSLDWLAYLLAAFLMVFAVANLVLVVTILFTWVER